MDAIETVVVTVVFLAGCTMSGLIGNIMGWRSGRKLGRREGFDKYTRLLRFERREQALIVATDQPHSRRPKGRARVTDAHFSQVRRHWTEQ